MDCQDVLYRRSLLTQWRFQGDQISDETPKLNINIMPMKPLIVY